ncbi:helix-turn-helix transcriptional regulator [Halomonas sp. XH26]|uniref:Helix-turn-helix transcriptional regulator n=1 Tax=Vreelandella alkaliphila TaxID=272774 RepID=A0AAJ2RXF3_9GAMM|nr:MULTISPECIES: helix-turn-helix transcriptional regulator [Halomonas]AIA76280.1 AraC family transcriptional regulator [Halomonas campaniensis]MDX5976164.1 helix-turn-helix transcriptional regulator [Halomonas alkaliphila]UTA81655.1 helix-turn-helix transcriptional regulator [Halomonas sp. XH26]
MFNAMMRAEIWLQDTLDKPLGIEDLANHLGYSASQIRRQFRHCFNISPSAYREKRRLERAAVLLSLTSQNIAQIAIRCGYTNHSSFSRAFQRRYRLSPREYRQVVSSLYLLNRPDKKFTISIEKNRPAHVVLMRLYQAPDHIHGLGNTKYHANHLEHLQAQLETSTPTMVLPDLLTEKVTAAVEEPAPNHTRTDIGLYLENRDTAEYLALPVNYRRVDIPSRYYAKIYFDNISQLSYVMSETLVALMDEKNRLNISGDAPQVLWHPDHIELRIPLSA